KAPQRLHRLQVGGGGRGVPGHVDAAAEPELPHRSEHDGDQVEHARDPGIGNRRPASPRRTHDRPPTGASAFARGSPLINSQNAATTSASMPGSPNSFSSLMRSGITNMVAAIAKTRPEPTMPR